MFFAYNFFFSSEHASDFSNKYKDNNETHILDAEVPKNIVDEKS